MSKSVFAEILRKKCEVSNTNLEFLWLKAKEAALPVQVFELIKPHLNLIPEIQNQYLKKGLIKGIKCKLTIKSEILKRLKQGGQYTSALVETIPADVELVISCLNELSIAERITFSYCPVENARFYTATDHYLEIQSSIIKLINRSEGVDKDQICTELRGMKKRAIRQNLNDLIKAGQIHLKQGKYTC